MTTIFWIVICLVLVYWVIVGVFSLLGRMIKTTGSAVEKTIETSRYIAQVVTYGDQRKHLTGVITLDPGTDIVVPGDNVNFEVDLIEPVALNKGLRFAIREGGGTVGAGTVTEIVE